MQPIKQGIDVFIHDTAILKYKEGILIGNHVAIDPYTVCSTQLYVGDYVHISSHVSIIGGSASKLILEDFSFLASGTRVVCGSEDYTDGLIGPCIPKQYRKLKLTTVTLNRFCGCGVNSVIMPGVTMAIGSVLGANSLLTKDTEEWGIYVGSPAKKIGIRKKEFILKSYSEIENWKQI